MTTPDEMTAAMMAASRELQRLVDNQPGLVITESAALRLSSLAEATAYLASSGTVAERQAHVVKACAEEIYKTKLAEGLRKSNELAIRAAMQRLSALQSISSALREELKFGRVGGGA